MQIRAQQKLSQFLGLISLSRAALGPLSPATSTCAPLPVPKVLIPTLGVSAMGNGDSCIHATLPLLGRNTVTNSPILWLTRQRGEKGTYMRHLLCSERQRWVWTETSTLPPAGQLRCATQRLLRVVIWVHTSQTQALVHSWFRKCFFSDTRQLKQTITRLSRSFWNTFALHTTRDYTAQMEIKQ